jgi:PIN domain nuclease of toxin-antitoxin system
VSEVVLDASALLALLNQESGGEAVATLITQAAIGTVNLSEVVAKLVSNRVPEVIVRQVLESLALEIIPFDESQAFLAGRLHSDTKEFGLSLGDHACLALAIQLNQPVLTADQIWSNLNLGIEIRVIR